MTFEVRERKLGRSDVKFEIKRDGEKFGTMTISNGSVVWFPRSLSDFRRKSFVFNDGPCQLETVNTVI